MLSTALPVHRVTSTPHVHFNGLSRFLDFVCAFRCTRHNHRVTIERVAAGRIRLAACCEELLDTIDRNLKARSS